MLLPNVNIYMTNKFYDTLKNAKKITALKIFQGGKALQVKNKDNEIFNIMTVKVRGKYLVLI